MANSIRVLILDDSENDAFLISKTLEKHGYDLDWQRVHSPETYQSALESQFWDVIISDYNMPRFTGLQALERLKATGKDIPFILVSGAIGEEVAVEAMKAGANDYVLKSNLKRLGPAVERELKEAQNRLELRRAEEHVQHYMSRLAHSNQALSQLTTVAAHDLQEPVRKIQVLSEYLQVSEQDRLSEDGNACILRIQAAAELIRNFITDLWDLSQVNAKEQPFSPTDLNQVTGRVLNDLQRTLQNTQGRVMVEHLAVIEANPRQMEQLFLNLLVNALKFRREGVPPNIKITGEYQEDFYRIQICDNGIGFDEKYADRIFKVFEQLHGREVYEGTGIGLALCSTIVKRHGGSISAASVIGEGSTFTIVLPVRQPYPRWEDAWTPTIGPKLENPLR